MNNGKTRSSLLGVAGGYLIYLAWQLFDARNDPNTTMTTVPRILFIALFVLAGAALLIYAFRSWKNSEKEEKENPPEDPNAMK